MKQSNRKHTSTAAMLRHLNQADNLHVKGKLLEAFGLRFDAAQFAPKKFRSLLEAFLENNATLLTLLNVKHSEQHKLSCLSRRVADALYVQAWPDHCQTCGGTGIACYSYDPSPAGVSLSAGSMTDCDPCSDCEEKGLCPRCKFPRVWDEVLESHLACSACGFYNGPDEQHWTPGRPMIDCYCHESIMFKQMDEERQAMRAAEVANEKAAEDRNERRLYGGDQ